MIITNAQEIETYGYSHLHPSKTVKIMSGEFFPIDRKTLKNLQHSTNLSTFSFLSRGIILWIELPWPENPVNTYAWHKETLDSCFDPIRFHQQYILWSPPLEIEPVTSDCRAETLQLSHHSILHTFDAKLTSLYPCPWGHNNYADVYF